MEEVFEERVINFSTFGMILDRQRKRIIPQSHLLDDIVVGTPSFDFKIVCDLIDRLMMRTVYVFESMLRIAVVMQWLDILLFLFRQSMTGNVKPEGTAQSYIQDLNTPANSENRQPPHERL